MSLKGDPILNYRLLNEALNERSYFLQAAPYMNYQMKLVTPSESLFRTCFFNFPGAILYHMFYMKFLINSSFSVSLKGPRFLLPHQVINEYPKANQLHKMNGVTLHEVQTLDSRMSLNCLLTSSIDKFIPGMKGTTLANYVVFKDFVKDENGKISGAKLYDNINKKEFTVKTKVVVNCAGQHADKVRLQDNDKAEEK